MLETIIIFVFTVVDQLVKLWAAGPLKSIYGGDLPLIEGVFHFTYVENRGAAFGVLQNARVFFIILTLCAIAALTVYLVKKRRSLGLFLRVALALVYAGAVGNLIDRVLLGYVRDMFDFRLIHFYVFNVADACVSVGGAMIVLFLIMDEFRQRKKAKEAKQKTENGGEAGQPAPETEGSISPNGLKAEDLPAEPDQNEPEEPAAVSDEATQEEDESKAGKAEENHAD